MSESVYRWIAVKETVESAIPEFIDGIPGYVIEELARVRSIGQVNILDRVGVAILSTANVRTWLLANEDRYIDALNAMGMSIIKAAQL
jgi:hypothetical protein